MTGCFWAWVAGMFGGMIGTWIFILLKKLNQPEGNGDE